MVLFRQIICGLLSSFALTTTVCAQAEPSAMAAAREWVDTHLAADTSELPFSFRYADKPFSEIVHRFDTKLTEDARDEFDELRSRRELTFYDPETSLEVRCVAVEYRDFPTVEWTLYFKNNGTKDTPILSVIRALDIVVDRKAGNEFVLHHHKGSRAHQDDFRPRATVLDAGIELRLRSHGGRGTNGTLPYFNLQGPEQGIIAVVGWPGQWMAQFHRDLTTKLHVRAGQEDTHFKLLPGEEVRSPLIVLQFYEGEPQHAQNIWRRWMVRHNLPRVQGELPPPQLVACSSHQFAEMMNATEENQKQFVDRYVDEKLGISYWWMDAGWYVNNGHWVNTGTWEVDRKRFPRGLRAITDHARSKGVKSIVWFEPERVAPDSQLYDEHPDWLLTPPANPGNQQYRDEWRLLNLGNPEALSWLTEHVDRLIEEEGIDLYRQDFNVDPLLFWQANDVPDRQGISEIKHVMGYLAFWDELRKRHPFLRIDACASGGLRLDLETLRRAVPLLRSDYIFEPTGQQCHMYGISYWIPYNGTGTSIGKSAIGANASEEVDAYDFRSQMASNLTACWDVRRKDLNYDKMRLLTSQFREASPSFLGDFYPLTSYSVRPDAWMAWQYDRREKGKGIVQAFRREANSESTQVFELRGLDPDAQYELTIADDGDGAVTTSAELEGATLTVELRKPRSAALIYYRKLDEKNVN
jgi:alpha-galactosidase